MKNALLVCMDHYPNGDAGAVRTQAFAKILKSIGYEPTIVSLGETTNFEFKMYETFPYISLRSPASDICSKIINRVSFHQRLNRYLLKDRGTWDVIVFSGVSKRTIDVFKKYSFRSQIPIIHDSVEWYSPEQFSIGKFHPAYIAKDRLNRKHIDQSMRVVAISCYLEAYFLKRGIKTTRIPVIMDIKAMPQEKAIAPHKMVFIYAGSPGKKDYLNVIISGFAKVKTSVQYELRMIGITKEQLSTQCAVDPSDIKVLGERLCCMGRISREQVLEQLSQADFTVLMRSEEQRYAQAGFPTKFVESLATATPVISNATSDISNYLQDGENGFVVAECSAGALVKAVDRALLLSLDKRKSMQSAARKTAENYFDYRRYLDQLKQLIDKT